MTIFLILNKTLSKLKNLKRKDAPHEFKFDDAVIRKALDIDRTYTLKTLDQLFTEYQNRPVNHDNLKPFADFLAYRWEKILINTNYAYFLQPYNEINELCLELATELSTSGQFRRHKFELLMPTMTTYNQVTTQTLEELDAEADHFIAQELRRRRSMRTKAAQIQGIEISMQKEAEQDNKLRKQEEHKRKLMLHKFILSDDNKYPIQVYECLLDASDDVTLKHTNVLHNNYAKPLTDREKKLVINHSIHTNRYYNALSDYDKVRKNGDTVGGAVYRLILQLRAGGVRGGRGGTDDHAGKDAMQGIADFHTFLKNLTPEENEIVMQLQVSDYACARNFEMLWLHLFVRAVMFEYILLTPEEHQMLAIACFERELFQQIPCVEVIANDLEKLLTLYSDFLYSLIPVNIITTTPASLQACKSHLEIAEDYLRRNLESDEYRILATYGPEGERIFSANVYLNLVRTPEDLVSCLSDIRIEAQNEVLYLLLGAWGLQNIIKTPKDLINTLQPQLILKGQAAILELLGGGYLRKLIVEPRILREILLRVSSEVGLRLLNDLLGPSHIEMIKASDNDCPLIFKDLPEAFKILLIDPPLSFSPSLNSFGLFSFPQLQEEKLDDEALSPSLLN